MDPRASVRVVEVVVCYGDAILDVRHIPARTRAGTRGSFAIGESPAADFTVSGATLPSPDRFVLLHACERAPGFVFMFHPSMRGRFVTAGERSSLASLVERGAATPRGEHFSHPLPPGSRAILQPGDGPLRIYLRTVPAAAPSLSRPPLDKLWCGCVSGSAAVIVAMVLLILSLPPERQLVMDTPHLELLLGTMPVQRSEFERDEQEPIEHEQSPEHPTRAHGLDEPIHVRVPTGTGPSLGREGHSSRSSPPEPIICQLPAPTITRPTTSNAGILALAGPYMERFATMSTGAYTPDADDRELWTRMTGGDPPEYTVGGIGLVASDARRGGQADDMIGLRRGDVGLIGHGGYGSASFGHGRTAGFAPRPVAHHVHVAQTSSFGEADTQLARRIIRAHRNELESCYRAHAHRSIPRGRMISSFTVSAEGRVLSSTTKHSELYTPEFERCLNRAIERWRFPKPQWGMARFEQTLELRP